MLHVLSQEHDGAAGPEQIILVEEFVELVRTCMKKELIMQTSTLLGIHYDILGEESVEFLCLIRGSLGEDEGMGVAQQLRNLFAPIIQRKTIAMRQRAGGRVIEVLDFS